MILEESCRRFPWLAEADEVRLAVLKEGGSGRRYFRLEPDKGRPVVVMHYDLERKENGDFVAVTAYLHQIGVSGPELLGTDEALQLVWLEDLGGQDLWSLRDEPWEGPRRELYFGALDEVFKIHGIDEAGHFHSNGLPPLQHAFDAALYHWEQDYFFENFVARFSTCPEEEAEKVRQSPVLASIAEELSRLPRRLIHRDFQSQNVMIFDGQPHLIDYQGLRFGRPEYDVAALVYDPYVDLTPGQRNDLIAHYRLLLEAQGGDAAGFPERLRKCALQRLMQALGAYGFLGLVKGKREFLGHIPAAVERLKILVDENETFSFLSPVLSLKDINLG